jgi:hypothetical protein
MLRIAQYLLHQKYWIDSFVQHDRVSLKDDVYEQPRESWNLFDLS